jgi:hypothetical protein
MMVIWPGSALAQGSGADSSPQSVRPIGVVTRLQPGSLTLQTDAGPDLLIEPGDGVTFLRYPPGDKFEYGQQDHHHQLTGGLQNHILGPKYFNFPCRKTIACRFSDEQTFA